MLVSGFEVVDMATDQVVHTLKLKQPVDDSGRRYEKLLKGLLMRVDTDHYVVRDVTAEGTA